MLRRLPSILPLLLVLAVVEVLLVARTAAVDRRIRAVSALPGFVGAGAGSEPAPLLLPAFDAYQWVRLSREMSERDAWRLRRCAFDDAPSGRDVYWSSGFAWWLRGVAGAVRVVTGEPSRAAFDRAAIWATPLLLMLLIPAVAFTLTRCWGQAPAAVASIWMAGDARFAEGFLPGQADHHGISAAMALLTLLGLVVALESEGERARRAGLLVSSMAGATGLWVSAISQSFVLVAAGTGILVAAWVARGHATAAWEDGSTWRSWARAGAAASLVLYLLEQFPDRLGMRLEVNHPLSALAWLGAGEILGEIVPRLAGRRAPFRIGALAAGALMLATLPCAFVAGGARWYALRDPFLFALHSHVDEFRPLHEKLGAASVPVHAGWLLILLAFLVLPLAAGPRPRSRALRAFGLTAAGALAMAQFWQFRWGIVASGAVVALAILLARELTHRVRAGERRAALGPALLALACAWPLLTLVREAREDIAGSREPAASLDAGEAHQIFERDVARIIAAEAGGAPVTILSSPNATLRVASFGEFRGIGTLYWENARGLRAAAEMWGAPVEAALPLLEARGVTHLLVFMHDPFMEEWLDLLWPDMPAEQRERTLGVATGLRGNLPAWLRPIPVPRTAFMRGAGLAVRLCRVVPGQGRAEALHHFGIAREAEGDLPGAEAAWREALRIDPTAAATRERLAGLLTAQGSAEGAALLVDAPPEPAPP